MFVHVHAHAVVNLRKKTHSGINLSFKCANGATGGAVNIGSVSSVISFPCFYKVVQECWFTFGKFLSEREACLCHVHIAALKHNPNVFTVPEKPPDKRLHAYIALGTLFRCLSFFN
jgi:hypothetical protein